MYCDDSLSQHSIFQILFSRKASKEKEKEKEKKRKEKKRKRKPSIAPTFASDSPVCFFFPLTRMSATTIDYAPFPGHEASSSYHPPGLTSTTSFYHHQLHSLRTEPYAPNPNPSDRLFPSPAPSPRP